jgi:hypothetical protein
VAHEWLTEVLFHEVQHQFGYVGDVALIALVDCQRPCWCSCG